VKKTRGRKSRATVPLKLDGPVKLASEFEPDFQKETKNGSHYYDALDLNFEELATLIPSNQKCPRKG
jgi:hypothetical protein